LCSRVEGKVLVKYITQDLEFCAGRGKEKVVCGGGGRGLQMMVYCEVKSGGIVVSKQCAWDLGQL
jgi:hypothetical protein